MPEDEHEVVVYDVEYLCDECEQPMKSRAIVATGNAHSFLHTCPKGHEIKLQARYPLTIHRRIDG